MKLNTKITENAQSNSLFNVKLPSVMSLILTCIHWCFIWQLHYFLSILFPILSHRFMKHGTYIAYHKTSLLSMALLNWCHHFIMRPPNISIFDRFSGNDEVLFLWFGWPKKRWRHIIRSEASLGILSTIKLPNTPRLRDEQIWLTETELQIVI